MVNNHKKSIQDIPNQHLESKKRQLSTNRLAVKEDPHKSDLVIILVLSSLSGYVVSKYVL